MISGVNHEPAAHAHGYASIGVRIRGGGAQLTASYRPSSPPRLSLLKTAPSPPSANRPSVKTPPSSPHTDEANCR